MVSDDSFIELNRRVLRANDLVSGGLRERFAHAGIRVANLISAPGTGKTELVVALGELAASAGVEMAVLVGDCATDNDARRIAASCPMVRQIVTDGLCHLEASMIGEALSGFDLAEIDLLLIENVGNLVCPSDFDLGEDLKVALLSVTEGEDKPLKYPHLFSSADLVVVTKLDLAEAAGCDLGELGANIAAVNPGALVIYTSARSGDGIGQLFKVLAVGG